MPVWNRPAAVAAARAQPFGARLSAVPIAHWWPGSPG